MLHGKIGLGTGEAQAGRVSYQGRLFCSGVCGEPSGWKDSSDHWHWSRPHLPGPRTKATRLRPQGYCPGFL